MYCSTGLNPSLAQPLDLVRPPSCTKRRGRGRSLLGRWIKIGRPIFAYPFAVHLLSQPFDLNRAAQRRRPPPAPLSLSRVQRAMAVEWGATSSRHFGRYSTGLCAAFNASTCSSPGSPRATCSRPSQSSLGRERTRGSPAVALFLPGYLSPLASFLGFH